MLFEGSKFKVFMLSTLLFIVGMFSVSISNIFGGYYCFVAALEVVLLTLTIYNFFDKKEINKFSVVSLSLCAFITALGIVFFIVNDVFKVNVYAKNSFDFLSIIVLFSQLLSIIGIVYTSVIFVVDANKNNVEVVDGAKHNDNPSVDSIDIEKKEETIVEEKKEIKYIGQGSVDVDIPFMEEEK